VTPTASTVTDRPPASAPVPVVAPRTPASLIPRRRRDVAGVVRAYVALTKPRIVELLLVTTVPAMMVAAGGLPPLWLAAVVLVGGSLAAAAANALNCYIDRDIDQVMRRTSRRPLPAHTVSPRAALTFGLALAVASVALMAAFTNPLAAGLTLAAIVYYDVVYTMWLKTRCGAARAGRRRC
jgi:heme o synthase